MQGSTFFIYFGCWVQVLAISSTSTTNDQNISYIIEVTDMHNGCRRLVSFVVLEHLICCSSWCSTKLPNMWYLSFVWVDGEHNCNLDIWIKCMMRDLHLGSNESFFFFF